MVLPHPPPWKLWGQTQIVEVANAAGAGGSVESDQLVKVEYKRPDTFRFWLFARLVQGQTAPIAAQSFSVHFNVTTGVGLSNFQSRPGSIGNQGRFGFMRWDVAPTVPPGSQAGNVKWTSRVRGPLLDDSDATSFQLIDQFVAQSIQGNALCIVASPEPGPVRFEVGMFVAPNVHVRPDWFADGPSSVQFRGSEQGGS